MTSTDKALLTSIYLYFISTAFVGVWISLVINIVKFLCF